MKGVAAAYPKWNEKLGKPINLEQRINICRSGAALKAEPYAFGSPNTELTAMTTYIRNQSRGMPVAVKVDGPMTPWFERGKSLYYQRNGQLDLACASCHEKNHGKYLRPISSARGRATASPSTACATSAGAAARAHGGLHADVRATPFKPLSDEFLPWRPTSRGAASAFRSRRPPYATEGRSSHDLTPRLPADRRRHRALVPTGWTRAFAQQRLTQDDLLPSSRWATSPWST